TRRHSHRRRFRRRGTDRLPRPRPSLLHHPAGDPARWCRTGRGAAMRQLAGRVAVVTGAASGIGQALAARLAAEGMHCVLADIEEEALQPAVADLRRSGASAIAVRTDVADPAEMAALNGHPLGLAPYTTAKFGVLGL